MLDLGRTFLQSVERSPHAPAIVDGDLMLTYAQWYERIRCVASGLHEIGLEPGDRLLAVLQNRWEMATLHWACQFAGIVMVPLNWRAKPEELDYCVQDAAVKALVFEPVSSDAVLASPAAQAVPCIALDCAAGGSMSFASLLDSVALHDAPVAEASAVSLMLYTSGTTGKPKGVPRRHRQERAAALAHVA
ncbi:AMP-binding protein, partial [Cupriavidus sp. CuC1]|uniref:AMP-binding protein n=1 Tax=Cupriavidus sp. CuC1 TaxID=3373131 RepID=UPI0037D2F667